MAILAAYPPDNRTHFNDEAWHSMLLPYASVAEEIWMDTNFNGGRSDTFGSRMLGTYPVLNQLFRYFFTGGTAAIVDIGAFVLLMSQGAKVLVAAISSFAVAAVVNYLLSSRFVFASKASGRQFLLFALAATLGLAVNVGITYLKVTHFGIAPPLAKTLGIGFAFFVNFLVNRALVFRQ